MRSEIPPAFRHVVLHRPDTWSRATLWEWIEKRRELEERKKKNRGWRQELIRHLRAVERVKKKLRGEEKAAGRRMAGPLSGRQLHRFNQLYEQVRPRRDKRRRGFSRWEGEFFRVSEWLDPFLRGEPPDDPEISHRLFKWVLSGEADLAARREADRLKRESSVALSSEERMEHNYNPFLPHPLELVRIYDRAVLVAGEMKRRLHRAEELGIVPDKYGAAYPCPECGEKYFTGTDALKCHSRLTREAERQYMEVLYVGSDDHRDLMQGMIEALWKSGYPTAVLDEEAMAWEEWPRLLNLPTHELARELVGRLLSASPDTVRRKIQRAELDRWYRTCRVALAWRRYCDRSEAPPPRLLLRPGWYRDLGRDRGPKPEYLGHAIFKMYPGEGA